MTGLSFHYYQVPDPMSNVETAADQMTFTERPEHLLLESYNEDIVEYVDLKQIKHILSLLTFENAKLVISAKNLLQNSECFFGEPLGQPLKEKWMKTKY